jgi:hypothetical protein
MSKNKGRRDERKEGKEPKATTVPTQLLKLESTGKRRQPR